ncbi:MAG: DNA polymerase [Saccharolobus sp.]
MKVYVLDCESYANKDGNPEFGLAIAKEIGTNHYLYFETRDQVIKWFLSKSKKEYKHVYIHNGLRFDLELIFGYKDLLKYNIVFNNGKIYKAKIGNTVIYDSYLLMPSKLSEIAENIGMKKGEWQEKLANISEDEFKKYKPEIEEYCKNDVDILEKALQWLFSFVKQQGIKKYYKYLTIASLSLNIIARKSKMKIKVWKINPYHQLFILSYYGARTENFYSGTYKGKIYAYDFNSLYPYCFSMPFPDKFLYAKININNEELLNIISNFEGFGYFEINAPKGIFGFYDNEKFIDIGLLPFRDLKEKKLLFPIGTFYGWYNFPEILYAIKHGYKIKALIVYVFSKKYYENVYAVIQEFYKLRKTDKNNSYLYKLMINSFYGKFGQKNKNQKYFLPNDKFKFNYEKYNYSYELDENNDVKYIIEEDKKYTLAKHDDFSIVSYITTYARLLLLNKFEEVIQKNGKIFYCDTDSIFTNIQLPTSQNIGDIKLEKEGIEVKIFGPKSYKFKDTNNVIHDKLKGVSKYAELIDETEDYEIYEYEQIIQLKTGLKKNYQNLTKTKTRKTIKYTYKRQPGKGFLDSIILSEQPDSEYVYSNLKSLFDKLNIEYPYSSNFTIKIENGDYNYGILS